MEIWGIKQAHIKLREDMSSLVYLFACQCKVAGWRSNVSMVRFQLITTSKINSNLFKSKTSHQVVQGLGLRINYWPSRFKLQGNQKQPYGNWASMVEGSFRDRRNCHLIIWVQMNWFLIMSMQAPGDCMHLPYFHVTAEESSEGIYPYLTRCIRKKM